LHIAGNCEGLLDACSDLATGYKRHFDFGVAVGKPCSCGHIASAYCVQCNKPLCNRHKVEWDKYKLMPFFWGLSRKNVPIIVLNAFESEKVPIGYCVVCRKCSEELKEAV
jgi:hypothetical protein